MPDLKGLKDLPERFVRTTPVAAPLEPLRKLGEKVVDVGRDVAKATGLTRKNLRKSGRQARRIGRDLARGVRRTIRSATSRR